MHEPRNGSPSTPRSPTSRSAADDRSFAAHELRKAAAATQLGEESLFECEYGCGYRGTYSSVMTHETRCRRRPETEGIGHRGGPKPSGGVSLVGGDALSLGPSSPTGFVSPRGVGGEKYSRMEAELARKIEEELELTEHYRLIAEEMEQTQLLADEEQRLLASDAQQVQALRRAHAASTPMEEYVMSVVRLPQKLTFLSSKMKVLSSNLTFLSVRRACRRWRSRLPGACSTRGRRPNRPRSRSSWSG